MTDRPGPYEPVDVEVRGGPLRVGIWGNEAGAPVLARIEGRALVVDRQGWTAAVTGMPYTERLTLPKSVSAGMRWLPALGRCSLEPLAGGWLSGKWRKGVEPPVPSTGRGARAHFQRRYDLDEPANAGKLDAADALATLAEEHGLTLVELAVAFVVNHPAVTSAIIGPRTLDQLTTQLPAADLTLTPEVLDRIDEIVAPGTTPNPFDSAYVNPALEPQALRR